MNFVETKLPGVMLLTANIIADERGYFFESYNEQAFQQAGIISSFVQDNQSKSSYGVLRGLHSQLGKYAQAKLVRVLAGKILDVAVDVRHGSSTYGQYVSVELSSQQQNQLFIPRGFLHGFVVLSESCTVAYKCDNFYCKEAEFSVLWNDPALNIDWQIPVKDIKVSSKDQLANRFEDAVNCRG